MQPASHRQRENLRLRKYRARIPCFLRFYRAHAWGEISPVIPHPHRQTTGNSPSHESSPYFSQSRRNTPCSGETWLQFPWTILPRSCRHLSPPSVSRNLDTIYSRRVCKRCINDTVAQLGKLLARLTLPQTEQYHMPLSVG
jgi:hypothetical protein